MSIRERLWCVRTTAKRALRPSPLPENMNLTRVLMDVRMSQMDKLTAVREARSLDRSDAQTVPIIAMTRDILDIDMDRLKSSGVDACLEKPFLPDDLFTALTARMRY